MSMQSLVEVQTFEKARDFLEALMPWSRQSAHQSSTRQLFRGHSDDRYELVPSALRPENWQKLLRISKFNSSEKVFDNRYLQCKLEELCLRYFYAISDRQGLYAPVIEDFRREINIHLPNMSKEPHSTRRWLPEDYLELAGIAQHYGIPTRLLDWTYDPLIAVHFASHSAHFGEYISVWRFDIDETFSQSLLFGMPLEVVTPAYRGNPNLAAQSGVFTHWTSVREDFSERHRNIERGDPGRVDRRPLDELLSKHLESASLYGTIFRRFRLPRQMAAEVRLMLQQLNYGPARIYPGYSGVVKQLLDEL